MKKVSEDGERRVDNKNCCCGEEVVLCCVCEEVKDEREREK